MKKVVIEVLKKFKFKIFMFIIFLGFNSYILTCPPKIIGNIIDLLYDIEKNKTIILNYTYYLIGVCIVYLANRFIWKRLEIHLSRGFERELNIRLFKRLLKLKLKDIQTIKNGEIMSYFVKDVNEMRAGFYRLISHLTRSVFLCMLVTLQMINGTNVYLTIAVIIPLLIGGYTVTKIKKYIEQSFEKSQRM